MLFRCSLHVVGNGVCLVMLCAETARRESRCPLYRVSHFSCTKSHKLNHNIIWSHLTHFQPPIQVMNMGIWPSTSTFRSNIDGTILQCLRLKGWLSSSERNPLISTVFLQERVLLPSHVVGSLVCLVLLGLFWQRCESRCPLYCIPKFPWQVLLSK